MEVLAFILVWVAIVFIARGIAKNRKVDVSTATLLTVFLGIFGIAYALLAKPKQTLQEVKEDEIDNKIQRFEKLKILKEEGLISEDEFNSEKAELKKVIEAPTDFEYNTIKHIKGKPEVVTRQHWEKLMSRFGSSNYIILSYH